MTQTNTTQNGNAINRIIERTDEITKRELSGNDPSYKIGDNPNEFYQNGTLQVQNASTQPTTQNKEELNINDLLDTFESDVICELGIEPDGDNLSVKTTDEVVEALQPVVEELLIQAHQSGIEEGARAERVKITKLLGDEYENMENNASFYLKLAALKENKQ